MMYLVSSILGELGYTIIHKFMLYPDDHLIIYKL